MCGPGVDVDTQQTNESQAVKQSNIKGSQQLYTDQGCVSCFFLLAPLRSPLQLVLQTFIIPSGFFFWLMALLIPFSLLVPSSRCSVLPNNSPSLLQSLTFQIKKFILQKLGLFFILLQWLFRHFSIVSRYCTICSVSFIAFSFIANSELYFCLMSTEFVGEKKSLQCDFEGFD